MDIKTIRQEIKSEWWLVIIFILAIILRLPSLFEPFTYGDEGVYMVIGQGIRKGLVLYRDIHDNKPPMIYLVAALANQYFVYRAIFFVWGLFTISMFFNLVFFLTKKSKIASFFATLIFCVLYSIRLFEGNIANAENFFLLTTITGFYLFFTARSKTKIFLSGLMLSLSILFKFPAVFDGLAIVAITILDLKKGKFRKWATTTAVFACGILLPVILTGFYFYLHQSLNLYLKAAFFQNVSYLSSWSSQHNKVFSLPTALIVRGVIVGLSWIVVWLFRKRVSQVGRIAIVWFSFSLFGSLMSARPYPHYLLQVIPPLCLSVALLLNKGKDKLIPIILVFALYLSFNYFHFWKYQNISYYQNFYSYAFGLKNKTQYFEYFGEDTINIYKTAYYISTRTSENERFFSWGNQPSLYALAKRLPVGKYTVAYHIIDFAAYQEIADLIDNQKPKYIVISKDETRLFPQLIGIISRSYLSEVTFGRFTIFQKINK